MADILHNLGNVELFHPSEEEDLVLERINQSTVGVSEMSSEEIKFLNGLIVRNKPRKLLELGVSSGGSTLIMLNAIADIPDSELHSIDYLEYYYKDKNRRVGYIIDNYPVLKSKWKLYTGGLSLKFMDKIGEGVDFCLIDTVHSNPGEILDFLMILPFLKPEAIIIFHDVNLHTVKYVKRQWCLTNNLLMSSIVGRKYIQGNFIRRKQGVFFPNIAAIKIDDQVFNNLFSIFNLLTIKWTYIPSSKELLEIISWFEKYYNEYYIEYIKNIFAYHNENFIRHGGMFKIKSTIKKMISPKIVNRLKKIMRI